MALNIKTRKERVALLAMRGFAFVLLYYSLYVLYAYLNRIIGVSFWIDNWCIDASQNIRFQWYWYFRFIMVLLTVDVAFTVSILLGVIFNITLGLALWEMKKWVPYIWGLSVTLFLIFWIFPTQAQWFKISHTGHLVNSAFYLTTLLFYVWLERRLKLNGEANRGDEKDHVPIRKKGGLNIQTGEQKMALILIRIIAAVCILAGVVSFYYYVDYLVTTSCGNPCCYIDTNQNIQFSWYRYLGFLWELLVRDVAFTLLEPLGSLSCIILGLAFWEMKKWFPYVWGWLIILELVIWVYPIKTQLIETAPDDDLFAVVLYLLLIALYMWLARRLKANEENDSIAMAAQEEC